MQTVDRTVVVATGGDPVDPSTRGSLPDAERVIVADSGLAIADALGLRVDLVVGDLDSVEPSALARAQAAGATVEQHRPDKDATDLELALRAAQRDGATKIVVVGGAGGRFDHVLANVSALCSPSLAGITVEALIGRARLTVIWERAVLAGLPGEYVSLLPIGGPAEGVVTSGLRYPVQGETLSPGSTRGVSNEFAAPVATIALTSGVLLAVAPGEAAPTSAKAIAGRAGETETAR